MTLGAAEGLEEVGRGNELDPKSARKSKELRREKE